MSDRLRGVLDAIVSYWENLTDRERKLLSGLGAVVGVFLVFLPVLFLSSSISSLEEDNEAIASTLRQIQRSRGRLAAQRAERAARDQRYSRPAPSLGSFLEAKAGEVELSVSDVQHEPERELGAFRVRHSRARIQGTNLRPAIRMLTAIKNSHYPIAIERIHMNHNQPRLFVFSYNDLNNRFLDKDEDIYN